MGRLAAIKKNNRKNNSGGIAPDALHVVNTLRIAITHFNKLFHASKDKEPLLITFIYLWMTQQLDSLTAAVDIPSLSRVTGKEACAEHRLRIININRISWVEYAQCYSTSTGNVWLWQPIPTALHHIFYSYVKTLATIAQKPLLNLTLKEQLWRFINSSWKTPKLCAQFGRLRKDVFFRYFTIMTLQSPYLSTPAKSVLLGDKTLHHHSAIAYQQKNSDQIRYEIFKAHNDYLERIVQAGSRYRINLALDNAHYNLSLLLDTKVTLPAYLTTAGKIIAFDRQKNPNDHGYQYVELSTIWVGSERALPLDDVRTFFLALDNNVKQHTVAKVATKTQLKAYYNALTYQLAFQFLILTGARPTHAISLETRRCYGTLQSTISDKGRYRTLYLCDYLQQTITHYLSIQQNLLTQLGSNASSPFLWFLFDENNQPQPLNARCMRQFMQQHWPYQSSKIKNIVPYCLRHTFAQLALSSTDPQLTTQHIDRLMGHSSFGEHLGSDQCFPINKKILLLFLNQVSKKLYFSLERSTLFSFSHIHLLQE